MATHDPKTVRCCKPLRRAPPSPVFINRGRVAQGLTCKALPPLALEQMTGFEPAPNRFKVDCSTNELHSRTNFSCPIPHGSALAYACDKTAAHRAVDHTVSLGSDPSIGTCWIEDFRRFDPPQRQAAVYAVLRAQQYFKLAQQMQRGHTKYRGSCRTKALRISHPYNFWTAIRRCDLQDRSCQTRDGARQ